MSNHKGIGIGHLNVRGLTNKVDEISDLIKQHQFKVFAVTETFLNKQHLNSLYSIDNYKLERRDRVGKQGGGVCLYIHQSVTFKRLSIIESTLPESLAILVTPPATKPYIIACIYRPSHSLSLWTTLFKQFVSECYTTCSDIIILGDFNINLLVPQQSWELLTQSLCLAQLVSHPTRISQNCSTPIDHIYVSQDHVYTDTKTIDIGLSDHSLICTVRKSTKNIASCHQLQKSITYYKWKDTNHNSFLHQLSLTNWDHIYLTPNTESMLTTFTNTLQSILSCHLKTKKRYVKSSILPPWLDKEVRASMKLRDQLKKDKNWLAYKKQRNYTTNLIKVKKKEHINQTISKSNNQDTRELWALLRNKPKTSFPHKMSNEYIETEDPKTIAEILNHHFTSVGENIKRPCTRKLITRTLTPETKMLKEIPPITIPDLFNYLQTIPSTKATGHDNLSPNILKTCLPYIARPLCDIFNRAISESHFPIMWKHALVTPLHKKDAMDNPNNYRPISVLPILSKVLEKHINKYVNDYLNETKLLSDNQSGFRSQHSCNTAIYKLYSNWLSTNKNDHLALLFIDFQKAFDMVPHDILLTKLKQAGIQGQALKLLTSFLKDRSQKVRIGKTFSSPLPIKRGVPQGSILSPTLFSIFINDLLSLTKHLESHAYADDTVFYGSFSSMTELESQTQTDINSIVSWCHNNGMIINSTKSHYVIKNCSGPVNLHINNVPLTKLPTSKLLGFVINDRLDWRDHLNTVISKVAQNTRLLIALRHFINKTIALKFYNHFIHSHISYGCGIYYPLAPKKLTNPLITLQKKALKQALQVPRRTPTNHIVTSSGVLLLPDLSLYANSILAYKTINHLCPRYITEIFFGATFNKSRYLIRPSSKLPSSLSYNALTQSTVNTYNSLPKSLRTAKNLHTFKSAVKKHLLAIHSD